MKVRIPQRALAEVTAFTSRHLPARAPIPVLHALLLTASPDGLRADATGGQSATAHATTACEVDEPGGVLVPGRLCADLARNLPDGEAVLALDGSVLVMECGATRYELPVLPADDYPAVQPLPAPVGELPGPLLAAGLAQVAFAACHGAAPKPWLSGVHLATTEAGTLLLEATDSYRLALTELAWQPVLDAPEVDAVAPAAELLEAARQLVHAEQVTIGLSGHTIALSGAGRAVVLPLIDATFTDAAERMPSDYPCTYTLPLGELADAVRRMAAVGARPARILIEPEGDGLALSASNAEGTGARELLPALVEGDPFPVRYDPGYLLDALRALPGPDVLVELPGQFKPARLRATGPDGPDTRTRHHVMPTRH